MERNKLWLSVLAVVAIIVVVGGATYAWYTWRSSTITISGTSGCFTIDYTKGTDISGGIKFSEGYTGGRTTGVVMGIHTGCTVTGTGTLYLNTDTENTTELLLTGGALKYQVKVGNNLVAAGVINNTSGTVSGNYRTIPIYSGFALSQGSTTTYDVYVWLDGELTNNDYAGAVYSGYISATAAQNPA